VRLVAEAPAATADLAEALGASLREVTSLRGKVELVRPGSLGDDDKVIDDRRG